MHKICKNCGGENDKDAQFCTACGSKTESPISQKQKVFSAKYLIPVFILVIGAIGAWYFISYNQPPNYFPLKAGMEWDYQVAGAEYSRAVFTNLPSQEMEGRQGVPQQRAFYAGLDSVQPFDTGFAFFYADKDGVHGYATQNSNQTSPEVYRVNKFLIKYPIQSGVKWADSNGDTATIESVSDTVTVPAGTFKNAVKIKYGSDTSAREWWFAPNVGLIMFTAAEGRVVNKLTNFKK